LIALILTILVIGGFLLNNSSRNKGSLFGAGAVETLECKALSNACKREILETESAQTSCGKYEANCLLEDDDDQSDQSIFADEEPIELPEDELFQE